MEDPST